MSFFRDAPSLVQVVVIGEEGCIPLILTLIETDEFTCTLYTLSIDTAENLFKIYIYFNSKTSVMMLINNRFKLFLYNLWPLKVFFDKTSGHHRDLHMHLLVKR